MLFTEMSESFLATRNVSNHVVILGFFQREKIEVVPVDGGTDFGDDISCSSLQPPVLEASVTSIQENTEEKVSEVVAAGVEPAEEEDNTNSEMRQLMSQVRQNFGRINVAPQFSEEDLVPVDVPDFDDTDTGFDDSFREEEEEEENEENERPQDPGEQELQVAAPGAQESSKTVLKALEDKIAKYKKFLDKAKAKRFSAIRYLNLSNTLQGEKGLMRLCCSLTPFLTCLTSSPVLAHTSCHSLSGLALRVGNGAKQQFDFERLFQELLFTSKLKIFSLLESCLLNYGLELPLSWFSGQQYCILDLSLVWGTTKAGCAWVVPACAVNPGP